MPTRIILDCDPGIDDALAIAFAHGHPGIELAGITTVAGNVGLDKTTANALAVCEFTGAGPLLRPALDARQVHGDSGLGGAVLPPAAASPAPGHAIDYIVDTVRAAPGEITLVATGPLTNIALAVKREPRLADWVRGFVIMGGSAGRGNVTPAAEYNIWAARLRAAVARPGAVPVGQRAWRPARARRLRGGVGGGARSVRPGPGAGSGGGGGAVHGRHDRDRLRFPR
jgi:purine nucleosidase